MTTSVEGNLKLIAIVVLIFWFFLKILFLTRAPCKCNLVRILAVTLNQVVTPCVHFSVLIYWPPM